MRRGYSHLRRLPTGVLAGLQSTIFQVDLVVGVASYQPQTRFSFDSWSHAEHAISNWNGIGMPPGYREESRWLSKS
jgi:hypothetical protein